MIKTYFLNLRLKSIWQSVKPKLYRKLDSLFPPQGITPEGVRFNLPEVPNVHFSVSSSQISSLSKEDKIATLKEILGRFIGGKRDEIPSVLKSLIEDPDSQVGRAAELLFALFRKYQGKNLLAEETNELQEGLKGLGFEVRVQRDLIARTELARKIFEKRIISQELLGLLDIEYSPQTEREKIKSNPFSDEELEITEAPPIGVFETAAMNLEFGSHIMPDRISIKRTDFVEMFKPLPISDFARSLIIMEPKLVDLLFKCVGFSKAAEFFEFLFTEHGGKVFWATMTRFKKANAQDNMADKRSEVISNFLSSLRSSNFIAKILSSKELSFRNTQILLNLLHPNLRKRVLASTKLKIEEDLLLKKPG